MAASNYYPPRGQGWGRWRRWAMWLQRVTYADHIKIPPGTWTTMGVLLVPGRGFFMAGQSRLGRLSRVVYVLALGFFLVRFGFPEANAAFGLAVAAHAAGVMLWCRPWLADQPLGHRMGRKMLLLVIVWLMIYMPLLGLMSRVLYPLQTKGAVVICNALRRAGRVQTGDWVAYHVPARWRGRNIFFQGGFGMGRVYGMPGDEIVFSPDRFTVNGIGYPRLEQMPQTGQWNVPTNAWFVWSQYMVVARHNISDADLSNEMMAQALVVQKNYVGEPFRHWCGRPQNLVDVPPEKLNVPQSRIAQ